MEGRDALLPNLPHPLISMVDGHSYVSLCDVISELLGHGSEIDVHGWSIDDNNKLVPCPPGELAVECFTQSEHGHAIYEDACKVHQFGAGFLPLWIIEWADDFKPNSQNKQNRGSVLVKTVTVSTPRSSIHSADNTYLIALGPKDADHEADECKFKEELEVLSCNAKHQVYCHLAKGMISVTAFMFMSLGNQPEKRDNCNITHGNRWFSARFSHSANVLG